MGIRGRLFFLFTRLLGWVDVTFSIWSLRKYSSYIARLAMLKSKTYLELLREIFKLFCSWRSRLLVLLRIWYQLHLDIIYVLCQFFTFFIHYSFNFLKNVFLLLVQFKDIRQFKFPNYLSILSISIIILSILWSWIETTSHASLCCFDHCTSWSCWLWYCWLRSVTCLYKFI